MRGSAVFLIFLLASLIGYSTGAGQSQKIEIDDNEFAEFEEFDEEEEVVSGAPENKGKQFPPPRQAEASAQDEDDEDGELKVEEDMEEEFDHFQDNEEFEGLDQDRQPVKSKGSEKPDLKITKVPLHLRSNWESFYVEFLMIAGLVVYFLNFIAGRNKNQKLANVWYNSHKQLLESNFALVGDDGKKEIENPGLLKESESVYTLWCSGRVCVEGMLVELRFLKRQDLVNVLTCLIRPSMDQIHIKVHMAPDAMDSFVFCLASKKTAIRLSKEMADISTYCPERKPAEKLGVPASYSLMNEVGEVASAMLDSRVISLLKKYEDCIDFLHFSDQYSGPKLQEDTQPSKLPEVKKTLLFGFNVPGKGHVTAETMENMKPLMLMVFYFIDKVKRYKLSKEAKIRAERNRQRVEEAFLKTTHAQRQEAAQQRREERKRQEKERILNEEDPEKQRKWEEREHRREMKKRAPRMKQLKVFT